MEIVSNVIYKSSHRRPKEYTQSKVNKNKGLNKSKDHLIHPVLGCSLFARCFFLEVLFTDF